MRIIIIFATTILLVSCQDIFTTNIFSSYKTDVSDMSDEQLKEYLSNTALSDISDEDLADAEEKLESNRSELSDSDKENPAKVAQYVEETTQLLDINMQQADVEGLISDVLSDDADTDMVDALLADTDRLDNIEEASSFAVDAYKADPTSLTDTELVVGGIGLLSDIYQDETKADALNAAENRDTDTLEASGFSADEIEDIQTAGAMLDLAEEGIDDSMSDLFEGISI